MVRIAVQSSYLPCLITEELVREQDRKGVRMKKVIAVDNAYAYRVTRDNGGDGQFDINKFQEVVKGKDVDVIDTLITVVQRVPEDDSPEALATIHSQVERSRYALEMMGCRVIVCPAKRTPAGGYKQSDDSRLMIATLAMCLKVRPDMLVFVGGDGDYASMVWALRDEGIRTEVVAERTSLASDLSRAAYNVIDLVDVMNSMRNGV
jgi:uncharacterized LabA/DUF88 family protein